MKRFKKHFSVVNMCTLPRFIIYLSRSSEDDSVYHSCVSQDETYQVSATDISGTTPTGGCITPTRGSETPPVLGALDISGITLTLGDASLSSTPTTVRNRYFIE